MSDEKELKQITHDAENSAMRLMMETSSVDDVISEFVNGFNGYDKNGDSMISDEELKNALGRLDVRPIDGKPIDIAKLSKALEREIMDIDSKDSYPNDGLIAPLKSIKALSEALKDFIEVDPKSLPPTEGNTGRSA